MNLEQEAAAVKAAAIVIHQSRCEIPCAGDGECCEPSDGETTLATLVVRTVAPHLNGSASTSEPPEGQPARVGINGYQSYLGRVREVTRFGAQFGQVACPDGQVVEFPPASVHSITWLSEDAYRVAITPRRALPAGEDDGLWDANSNEGDDEAPF